MKKDMNFYKTYVELPIKYKNYLKDYFKRRINSYYLIDWESYEFYCPNCYSVLDNVRCLKCNIDYSNQKWIAVANYKDHIIYDFRYLVIESDIHNVVTYIIDYSINYDKEFEKCETIPIRFRAYKIDKKGTLNLFSNKYDYLFRRKLNINENSPSRLNINLVYKDNLDDLNKNELYKYIDTDKYKILVNDLNDLFSYSFSSIILNPIIYKEFEYLLKMELYTLIKRGINIINKGKTFNEIFGVPKDYYSLMKEIDIDPEELIALRQYKTKDKDLLRFLGFLVSELQFCCYEDRIKEVKWFFDIYKNDMERLREYITKKEIDIIDYYDYLKWAKRFGFDIKSRKIKYPNNFMEEHDRLCSQITIIDNKERNDQLIKIHNYLKINSYEDDKYIIFPAYDVASIVDESSQMNNCVRTYIDKIIDHNAEIYFMREKENIDKSLVTVEVFDGEVVQAKRKNNTSITKEDEKFLKKFERQYTIVDFS